MLVTGAVALGPAASADGDHPGLSPESVDQMVLPGGTFEVEKTVHTPDLPPVLDVCLVVDLSGSYGDDLPNIKALAPGIWDEIVAGGVDLRFGLGTFVDFPWHNWGDPGFGDYAYRLDQQLTSDKATWVAAVNAMATRSGFDGPESQYEALFQVATGAGNDVLDAEPDDSGDVAAGQNCAFREKATKVVILTTDASFHNAGDGDGPFPYPGASAVDTTTALVDEGIKVIGLKAPGSGGELDALAAATGGTTQPTSSTSHDIAEAILTALEEIDVEVSMTSDCTDPLSTAFAPSSVVVENGQHAVFAETISVAADAPGGVYTCKDWALIDGQPMVDAAGDIVYETKRILVPENYVTGGGNITNGEKGKARATLVSFGGNAGYLSDGTMDGSWSFNFHEEGARFHTTDITGLQFSDTGLDPAPPEADADTVVVTASSRANFGDGWQDGCTVEFTLQDGGEPEEDTLVSFAGTCPDGAALHSGGLTGGNIQVHDGTKG